MADKSLIIQKFNALIELLKMEINLSHDKEVKTINSFKVDALERNMQTLSKMNISKVNVTDVKGIKGFGKGTLAKIEEIIKTGTIYDITILNKKLKKLYKLDILIKEISQVIGIGSITALRLIYDWNIVSLNDLKSRVRNGSIVVNDKIALGLRYEGKYEKEIKRKYITKIDEKITKILHNTCEHIICGSYRRQNAISHDIDMLIWSDSIVEQKDVKESDLLFNVIKILKKKGIITEGITSDSVTTKFMGFITYKNKLYRIDIRLIAKKSLYSAMLYFTGSYETNIKMRNRAKKLAYKLNEYGLFNVMGKPVPISSEADIFRILRMKYLEPWER